MSHLSLKQTSFLYIQKHVVKYTSEIHKSQFPLVFQEEDVNKTLDQAIEMARSMKKTTDRMARRLSADLAKAQLHRKLHHTQPLGGRKHQELQHTGLVVCTSVIPDVYCIRTPDALKEHIVITVCLICRCVFVISLIFFCFKQKKAENT